jgi:hypothetical protein
MVERFWDGDGSHLGATVALLRARPDGRPHSE